MNVTYECFCSSRYHESRYMSPVYVLILFSSKRNFKKYCGKIETSLCLLIFVIPCVFVGSFLEEWLGFLDFICTCCTVDCCISGNSESRTNKFDSKSHIHSICIEYILDERRLDIIS